MTIQQIISLFVQIVLLNSSVQLFESMKIVIYVVLELLYFLKFSNQFVNGIIIILFHSIFILFKHFRCKFQRFRGVSRPLLTGK